MVTEEQAAVIVAVSILTIWQLKVRGNVMQHNHNLAQSAYQ